MKQIKWIDGRTYNIESPKRFIELRQLRHPFCEKINNEEYMESVRFTYTDIFGVDEKLIDISSEDAFIKSFEALGEAKIIK
tara:strand:+ start:108 stop:350 length:243 start_codon:yes stop_codon:yes gene_type:complete